METGGKILIGFIVFMFVAAILIGVWEQDLKDNVYNGGICPDCGGHWHVVAHYKSTYTYECDTCYKTFRSSHLMR